MQIAHQHHAVSGKKLAADEYDHHQSDREDQTGDQFCHTRIFNGMDGKTAGGCTEGNKHTGKNTEKQYFPDRHFCFGFSLRDLRLHKRGRGVKTGSYILFVHFSIISLLWNKIV